MLLNVHSYYSLRYGTLSPTALVEKLMEQGICSAVLYARPYPSKCSA